jgi:electron transport complex protein RnfB
MNADLAQRIDALLPQTQCTQCGYDGCRPYAEALAAGTVDINRCPPGGEEGVARVATLLGRAPKPLDPECGPYRAPQVAVIDEAVCIGCTKCIQACPVDAIVGASKLMHTVIAAWCTGCERCIPPCPVDCIALEPVAALPEADLSRARHEARKVRLAREEAERAARLASLE